MITISFAPLPVGANGVPGQATDAAGFNAAMGAVTGQPPGNSFLPLIPTGPGALTANPGLPPGGLVAVQQPQYPLALSPTAAGPLVAPLVGLMQSPSQSDPLVLARRAAVEDRMPGLREIFAAALARDQANRPVQEIIGGAVQAAGNRYATNEAALAPAIPAMPAPGGTPPEPGVVDIVGSPSPVSPSPLEGAPDPTLDVQDPVHDVAGAIQSELAEAKAERSIEEMMKDELEKAQADRPIDATVDSDLEKAKEDRPIEQNMLDSLIAGKDELKLSEEAEEKLIEAVAGEGGTLDSETRKELLENADVMLQEKYQAIIDSFVERIGKPKPPEPAGAIA